MSTIIRINQLRDNGRQVETGRLKARQKDACLFVQLGQNHRQEVKTS